MAVIRNTKQRQAIREVFEAAGRPLSAAETVGLARRKQKALGTATVYRAINALVEDGWLVPVELPAEPARYEVAGLRHHHHFYCRSCRKVYDIEGCPSDFISFTPTGFELEAHEVILYGRCDKCTHAA